MAKYNLSKKKKNILLFLTQKKVKLFNTKEMEVKLISSMCYVDG